MNTVHPDAPFASGSNPIPTIPWGIRELIAGIILAGVGIGLINVAALVIAVSLGLPLRQDQSALFVFLVLQDLILIGSAWLFAVKRHRVGWDRLGLRGFSVPIGCTMSAALLIASYVVRFIYGLIIYALGVRIPPQEVLMRLDLEGAGIVWTLAVVAVLAPVAEEVFFRGFLYGGLRRRVGVGAAMLLSTVFFTALHLSIGLFIPILVLGLFLAWLYEHTGSLYPGILLHAANNALALLLLAALQASGQMPF